VPDLAADFLEEIAAVEAKRAELEGQLEEANARDEADDEDGVGAGGDDGEELLDATTLKKQLNVAKKQLKSLQGKLVERLQKSRVAMSDDELRALALTVLLAVYLSKTFMGRAIRAVASWRPMSPTSRAPSVLHR